MNCGVMLSLFPGFFWLFCTFSFFFIYKLVNPWPGRILFCYLCSPLICGTIFVLLLCWYVKISGNGFHFCWIALDLVIVIRYMDSRRCRSWAWIFGGFQNRLSLAMGKSPGKWIKTLLFGKKTARSQSSKGRDVLVCILVLFRSIKSGFVYNTLL